jgi:acetamidase/formamidase
MSKQIPLAQRHDPANDTRHCLVGPIAVRGAQSGQVLQVDICQLVPAAIGATCVGEVQEFLPQLGVAGYFWLPWQIDVATAMAHSSSGHQVPLAPFLDVLGVAPATLEFTPHGHPAPVAATSTARSSPSAALCPCRYR